MPRVAESMPASWAAETHERLEAGGAGAVSRRKGEGREARCRVVRRLSSFLAHTRVLHDEAGERSAGGTHRGQTLNAGRRRLPTAPVPGAAANREAEDG